MPSYPDIDKIDTNIRHALGILDLMMDNIGHRVDSDQDSMEFALWSAVKHLKEATNEIERVGDKNLADLLSKVDSDPLGEDEEDEPGEDSKNDDLVFEIQVGKDGEFADVERVFK